MSGSHSKRQDHGSRGTCIRHAVSMFAIYQAANRIESRTQRRSSGQAPWETSNGPL